MDQDRGFHTPHVNLLGPIFFGLGFEPDVKERDLNSGNGGGVPISGEDGIEWIPLERDEINHC